MKKNISFTILLLSFVFSIYAQDSFRIEANVGLTIGDSQEYYSYTLQGNFYYFWEVSKNIYIGPTTGALVFLGEGDNRNGSENFFGSIPEIYIPIAVASRIKLSKSISIGLDTGYGLNATLDSEEGGFYFRPLIVYNLKEKLALIGAYSNITEKAYTASTINFGVNFGF
tara:strand:+ start:38 stop:544 length:507 start_codon:yes stop_codon:yes gene_type:complete